MKLSTSRVKFLSRIIKGTSITTIALICHKTSKPGRTYVKMHLGLQKPQVGYQAIATYINKKLDKFIKETVKHNRTIGDNDFRNFSMIL